MECADEHPRLAAAFYAAGRGELLKQIAAFLKPLTTRGFLSIKDPELAAEQLVASWFGMSERRQSLGLAGPLSADAIAKRCRNKDRNGRLVCRGTGSKADSQASCFLKRYVSMTHPFRALASARIRSMSCMSSRSFPATRISSSVPIYAPQ